MSSQSNSFYTHRGLTKPDTEHIRLWENPPSNEIGNTVEEFLQILGQPTLLLISGKEHKELRAISTLLHGNEPSGLQAIYRWLKHGEKPATDILCFIGAVKTALTSPGFYYRHLPGQRDLNRCFVPTLPGAAPERDDAQLVASEFVRLLDHFQPACLIDVHNTSGKGPAFAVSITADHAHIEIAALFTSRMIVTDLRLGALMELSSARLPIVTIECGGAKQEASADMASRGLARYLHRASVFTPSPVLTSPLSEQHSQLAAFETLHNPIRIELKPSASIDYLNYKHPQNSITLLPTIEEDNFGIIGPDKQLGWVQGELDQQLKAVNSRGENVINLVLSVREGALYPARPIKMFMATTNASIAKSDCLFYVVDVDGKELIGSNR